VSSLRLNRLARFAPVAVAALVLSGCGAVAEPPAATINGTEVSQEELLDEARLIRDNETLRQDQERQGASIEGETPGSFDAAFVANLLRVRIYVAMVERELDRRGITVGEQELQVARAQLTQQLGGPEQLEAFPEEFIESQARQSAIVAALSGELVGGDAEALYEEDPGQFAELCVSHIFVNAQERGAEEAEERAEELAAQLEEGVPYDQLAAEENDDPQAADQDGSLGCGGRGRFIPEFEDAAFALDEGEVSDVVESPVGFHLIRVDERTERTFEEAREEIEATLQNEAGPAIQQFVADASAEVDVEVNPRFGTWVVDEGQAGRVEPPVGPTRPQPLAPAVDPFADPAVDPQPQS
jgi:parvulin-like peptidyl-prolyl isomerase